MTTFVNGLEKKRKREKVGWENECESDM